MITQKIQLTLEKDYVTLTTYVLDDSPELLAGRARPAVIICPGGAYLSCSDREAEPVALRFAAMGYHAFVLRYSVQNKGNPNAFQHGLSFDSAPEIHHPAPMRDIGRAMLFLHQQAKEWNIDTDRIALCGFSAGAHNSAMYSVHWHKPILTEFFNEPAEKFRPAATILAYPLTDYHYVVKEQSEGPNEQLRKASLQALLGEENPSAALLEEVSPVCQVDERTPPMFLWHTSEDSLVPPVHATDMAGALANKGIPFELHIFEKGEHGLSLATQASASNRSQIDRDAQQWAGLAQRWLEKRFALPVSAAPDLP